MINDILRLSAIDAGRVSLDVDDVNIEDLARDAVVAMTPAAQAKRNKLTFASNAVDTLAHTDQAKLDHCIRGLISHAIAFTEAGEISVRLSERCEGAERQFCFEVEDTGVAPDAMTINALFEPFAHTGDGKVARFDGPNIDLALCRRFAQLLGGDLEAQASVRGGMHFTFTAPFNAVSNKR